MVPFHLKLTFNEKGYIAEVQFSHIPILQVSEYADNQIYCN